MVYIKWINELSKEDEELFGEKAAYLGELMKINMPAPKGFAISSEAFSLFVSKFKSEMDSIVSQTDFSDFDRIHESAKQIYDLFMKYPIPSEILNEIIEAYKHFQTDVRELKDVSDETLSIIRAGRDLAFVSVRPSVVSEYAPMQQICLLNVKGEHELVAAVKSCWASLYSARALYFQHKNRVSSPSMAVIIQKMINSTKSGDLFTVNPLTNNRSEIMVQARWGYSQKDSEDPNTYVFNKSTNSLVESDESEQRLYSTKDSQTGKTVIKTLPDEFRDLSLLSQKELEILSRVGDRIENHFHFPQDVEWCVEKNNIYIVQSRPITRLFNKPLINPQAESDAPTGKTRLLKGIPVSPGRMHGSAKLLQVSEDQEFIDSNSVLVVSELTNELTPVAFKTGAIVADKGNLKSYTTILAREFGKPCLIKTKNATSILQDGQSIDVDADSGAVFGEPPIQAQTPVEQMGGGEFDFERDSEPAPSGAEAMPSHTLPPLHSTEQYRSTEPSAVMDGSGSKEQLKELHDNLAQLEQFMADKFFVLESELKDSGLNEEEVSNQLKDIEWKLRELRRRVLKLMKRGHA